MTPEQKILWNDVVAIVRNAPDRRNVCYTTVPHDVLLAADDDLVSLTRECDEAKERNEILSKGWSEFIQALEGHIPGIERTLTDALEDANQWTSFRSFAEYVYGAAVDDAENYNGEIADTAEKERDEAIKRAEAAERYAKIGILAEKWYTAKTRLERQSERPNDPPESYFERYENAERRLIDSITKLKINPSAVELPGVTDAE